MTPLAIILGMLLLIACCVIWVMVSIMYNALESAKYYQIQCEAACIKYDNERMKNLLEVS